ncbi:MAG: hypothetical protein SNH13_07015, partial [Rikenellaceae bacterium]
MIRFIPLLILATLLIWRVSAQTEEGSLFSYNTTDPLYFEGVVQPDSTLFSRSVIESSDLYATLTRYYQAGGESGASARRGGVAWWITKSLRNDTQWGEGELTQPLTRTSLRVNYEGRNSLFGVQASYVHIFKDSGWAISSDLNLRTGRNGEVDGLFASEVYPR